MVSVIEFLSVAGVLTNVQICPTLKNFGGYPKCTDYQSKSFDYIIVGGGAAGCVLANRLSKNPDVNVLLVEAGPYPTPLSEIPLEMPFLLRSQNDYNFTIQQADMFKAYKDKVGRLSQGRVLGGNSAINLMIDAPSIAYDYNKWADEVKDPQWAYDKLKPYFEKVSSMVKTTKYTAFRIPRWNLAQAAKDLGYSVNSETDILGYHDVPIMVHEKSRNSIARAYLKPIANRPNLCVVVDKKVNKIRINPVTHMATGVEIEEKSGPVFVPAKKEVIVTAGAIPSATLLMLSGVGPWKHLVSKEIFVIKNLPVGQIRDHVYAPIYIKTATELGLLTHEHYVNSYCKIGIPMHHIEISNFIGMINTKDEETHPNIEFGHIAYPLADRVFLPRVVQSFGYNDKIQQEILNANKYSGVMSFGISNLHPKAEGTILLKSSDPKDAPIYNGNYLGDADDVNDLIDAILDVMIPLMDTTPFALSKLIRFSLPTCDSIEMTEEYYKSRKYWECYLKYFATSAVRPTGTCRMGTDFTNSVVDTNFRVWGVQGLRVVGSGVIPTTLSGPSTKPSAMMAEKAADIILKEHKTWDVPILP